MTPTLKELLGRAGRGANKGDYERCIRRTMLSDGRIQIECRMGLWSVSAPSVSVAECEARHYWIQYFNDGDYNKLLNGTALNKP